MSNKDQLLNKSSLSHPISRRSALTQLSVLGVITLSACGKNQNAQGLSAGAEAGTMAGTEGGMVAGAEAGTEMTFCEPTPSQIEGPYYLELSDERLDITEGRPGAPLMMQLQVTNSDCSPISGALVEVWHADAAGVYSGFSGQSEETRGLDFLRGEAETDDNGNVQFSSIYPGWYPGRAVHVHFKVSLDGNTALTSQFYLPDDISVQIYQQEVYVERGEQDTPVPTDRFFLDAGDAKERLMVSVEPNDSGYVAHLQITV